MNKNSQATFLLLLLLFPNCTGDNGKNGTKTLTIAVAANVQFAIKEIEKVFEETTKIDLEVIIGSSGKLTAQIKQGAPYDLLISANMKYPENLFKEGFATTIPQVCALGSLVLWTLKDINLEKGLSVLTNKEVQKIAIANPKNAPYGSQAIKAFKYFGIYETIKPKLVYGESISQTNQYILLKACAVGITAKSVVLSPKLQGKGKWIAIDTAAFEPIMQGVIITKYGAKHHASLANIFHEFLLSPKVAVILKKYGYSIPDKK